MYLQWRKFDFFSLKPVEEQEIVSSITVNILSAEVSQQIVEF
jgi:hypothetical protein